MPCMFIRIFPLFGGPCDRMSSNTPFMPQLPKKQVTPEHQIQPSKTRNSEYQATHIYVTPNNLSMPPKELPVNQTLPPDISKYANSVLNLQFKFQVDWENAAVYMLLRSSTQPTPQ